MINEFICVIGFCSQVQQELKSYQYLKYIKEKTVSSGDA